jgi:hypothetical protein
MNSIEQMAAVLASDPRLSTKRFVTEAEYAEWRKQWVLDALREYRLGQSFCEYFGISNASPLYHFKNNIFCEGWIRDNYLEK